jgi:signal recognition particle subunit SRP19
MPDHFYVYPAYLTSSSSRALGRRVPKGAAVPEATIEEIVRAAQSLGFTAVAEPAKQFPRQFYTYAGRVKVTKKPAVTKSLFLRQLAAELHRLAAAPRSP